MTDFLMANGSYLGIIVVLILTGSGLPLPEEVPIIAAGILAAHGHLNPWLALGSCLVGAILGDCVMYWIGHHFGRRVLREQHWWTRFVKPGREAQIEAMLHRHGLKVFFLARFLVGIRAPVYLSAGILRVPFRRFLLIDLFCATAVIGLFFGLSYLYGPTITHLIRDVEYVLTGVVLVTLAGVGIYFWRRHRRRVIQLGHHSEPTHADRGDAGGDLPEDVDASEADWPRSSAREDQFAATPDRDARG